MTDVGTTPRSSRPPGYADTPWPAEDAGSRRQQRPHGLPGPAAASARPAAVRQAPITVMAILGPGDAVYVLRNTLGADAVSWVEELHPESLEELRRSPDLALGPFWPGGFAALDDGSVLVVEGRWAHRLSPDLEVIRSRELPVDAPYNSFVLLADGSVATKDLQRPGGPPSTLSVLDPVTLEDRAAPFRLHEPCVARLGADADELIVVGVTTTARYQWSSASATLAQRTDLDVEYLVHPGQSFGWDPVVDAGAVWWMDNGDHTFERGFTMLGNGVAPGPVRLWRAALDGKRVDAVEVCGRPGGSITNPPLIDIERGLAVAYDSSNAVLAAFDVATLAPRWQLPIATAQHLILFPDTGELIANDYRTDTGDAPALIDVETGEIRARVGVESPTQSVVFGAPGRRRDVYYVSLSTIARVVFED